MSTATTPIDRSACEAMAALEASLEIWADVDLARLRAKSLALTDLFIALVDERLAEWGIDVVTPREHARRGSQVALRGGDGYAVMQAIIARGVIGDFRAPDLMRFGFAPLYVTFADMWDAVEVLRDVLQSEEWRKPEYSRRGAVT